jgi:NADPH:quinone reductase-like Zn-dependent oxidoreductase
MTEVVTLNNTAATAALQVVIELIRAGHLKTGVDAENPATAIITAHKQLTEHFKSTTGKSSISVPLSR